MPKYLWQVSYSPHGVQGRWTAAVPTAGGRVALAIRG
jgi:hypothetical protein